MPALWLSEGLYLIGNLDRDGADEAVVHLTFSSGGTGNFGYLAVMGRQEGEIVQEAIGLIHRGRPGAVPAWQAHHGCRADLVERHRARIQERAYALSQDPPKGRGDAQFDWLQAEAEVLRTLLLCA